VQSLWEDAERVAEFVAARIRNANTRLTLVA